jgi:hypothetical protein
MALRRSRIARYAGTTTNAPPMTVLTTNSRTIFTGRGFINQQRKASVDSSDASARAEANSVPEAV